MSVLIVCMFVVKADSMEDLVRLGTLTRQAAAFLEAAVVSGPKRPRRRKEHRPVINGVYEGDLALRTQTPVRE